MISKLFVAVCSITLITLLLLSYIVLDSANCDFNWRIPSSDSQVSCQGGMYRTNTVITQKDETYRIITSAFYVKMLNRIVLIPYKNDIDVEHKGSLAVYDAEKIKTPHRTFGLQPVSSMTLLHDPSENLVGVVIFSDPNSVFVPAKFIKGSF